MEQIESLINSCSRYQNVICYGAAQYGYYVKKIFELENIKIKFFLISDEVEDGTILHGIPVYSVTNKDISLDNCAIMLALSVFYYDNVKANLRKRNISSEDIYEITDDMAAQMDEVVARHERKKELLEKPVSAILENNHIYMERVCEFKKHYKKIEVKFMMANHLGYMQDFITWYYEKESVKKQDIFYLLYPRELFRTYSGRNRAVANLYLLGKMSFKGIEVVSENNIDFWRYFIQTQPGFFVFDEQLEEIAEIVDVNKLGRVFRWDQEYIAFTSQEDLKAKEQFQVMGIKGEFVCLSNRDNAYYQQIGMKARGMGDQYRNSNITTRGLAVEYLATKNIQTVRMGSVADCPFNHPDVIDYAREHRTEFMDVYLASKCKFFICDSSGIVALAALFSKPRLITNVSLLTTRYDGMVFFSPQQDIAICKKMWDSAGKRFLSLREMLEVEMDFKYSYKLSDNAYKIYAERGIVPVENTAEEILGAVQELNDKIDQRYSYSDVDKDLAERYKKIMNEFNFKGNIPLFKCLSNDFLSRNSWLLD